MTDPRPIPVDPSAVTVKSMIEIDQSWLMAAPGDYEAFAVEAMTRSGTNWQRVVALRWPARINKTDEEVTLRLLVAPEDAIGLARVLMHTATWLASLAHLESDDDDNDWVCPACKGTRTIQPDRNSPPEECPRCVDPDEGA
jgi:hypothetical protein